MYLAYLSLKTLFQEPGQKDTECSISKDHGQVEMLLQHNKKEFVKPCDNTQKANYRQMEFTSGFELQHSIWFFQ